MSQQNHSRDSVTFQLVEKLKELHFLDRSGVFSLDWQLLSVLNIQGIRNWHTIVALDES
jgi:hypothetical protein